MTNLRLVAGRIHYDSSGNRDEIVKWFASKSDDIIFYDHVDGKNENPHLHFLISTDADLRTCRNWAVKVNPSYSFKEKQTKGPCKGQPVSLRMISYMSRGELDPYMVKSNTGVFTPNIVEQWKMLGYNKKEEKNTDIVGQVIVKKKPTEWSMVQEVVGDLEIDYPTGQSGKDTKYSAEEIFDKVYDIACQVRKKHEKLLPCKQMSDFLEKCQFYYDPAMYKYSVKRYFLK